MATTIGLGAEARSALFSRPGDLPGAKCHGRGRWAGGGTPILGPPQAESEGFFPVAGGQVDPASTRGAGRTGHGFVSSGRARQEGNGRDGAGGAEAPSGSRLHPVSPRVIPNWGTGGGQIESPKKKGLSITA